MEQETTTKKRRVSARGSKAKGSDFERELAAYLNETVGLRSRRALLSGGGRNDGGSDLDGTPMIHVEAKRTETFAPYAAMQQAEESIRRGDRLAMPVVIQRRNRMTTGQSMVVMRADDWAKMYAAFLRESGALNAPERNSFTDMLR
jgi:hypothetical protein